MRVEVLRIQRRDGRRAREAGRREAVDRRRVFRRRRAETEVAQEADEALEPAVAGQDLADARRRRGEVGEVRERVEQRQRRCCVERCDVWFSSVRRHARARWQQREKDIPLLSYNCDEIQTQALFCAGNAKLDSRMSSTARRRGLAMATMA